PCRRPCQGLPNAPRLGPERSGSLALHIVWASHRKWRECNWKRHRAGCRRIGRARPLFDRENRRWGDQHFRARTRYDDDAGHRTGNDCFPDTQKETSALFSTLSPYQTFLSVLGCLQKARYGSKAIKHVSCSSWRNYALDDFCDFAHYVASGI